MTTERQVRCKHCCGDYRYIVSSYFTTEETNDPDYCGECKAAILSALSSIPLKHVTEWVPTSEVTLQELLDQEKVAQAALDAKNGGLVIRRVSFPMYDTQTWETDISGYVTLNGRSYDYRYWKGREAEAEIRIKMERCVATGRRYPV